MKILNYCNKIIEYSFYLLFFLVPLALTNDTSELFEFNKLWLTFILTIIIGIAWITKMIVKKEVRIQRTPLDIPIGLFLISQVISTIFSLDTHTSLWGYYSRFNGGLFSIISYIFLYFAFVTNLKDEAKDQEKEDYNIVKSASIFAGGIALFMVGVLVSSQIKATTEAGIPFQLLALLSTAIASFFVFMKAAPKGILKRSIFSIFSAGIIIVLWGLPSHFGFDPTCLLFRGIFDVSCWTSDFQPMVRIFSTLGQPDWMAAYLAALIPILIAFFLNFVKGKEIFNKKSFLTKNLLVFLGYFTLFVLFYSAFLYTRSKSAIIASYLSLFAVFAFYLWYYLKPHFAKGKALPFGLKLSVVILAATFIIAFFEGFPSGFPFGHFNQFTWGVIKNSLVKPKPVVNKALQPSPTPAPAAVSFGELGGTDSGTIRSYVWKGAIEVWKNNPVFGTGLETFAFAYYMYRPVGHNMTSEWQFLYNKAHNEFLNYLATTGTVGIATYLFMIGSFYYISLKQIYKRKNNLSSNELLIFSIIIGYSTILVTNFGGFSVVIINIFFYLFPALVLMHSGLIDYEKSYKLILSKNQNLSLGMPQKISISVTGIIGIYLIYTLITFWNADRYYYFGYNYDRAGDYQKAYTFLKMAIDKRPSEPVFKDEFAYNNAVLGTALISQIQKTQTQQQQEQTQQIAKQLIQTALTTENQVNAQHPNNIVFWKTKVRILYILAQLDQSYLPQALEAIKKSAQLAPTDVDVSYNLGVLYGQNGDFKMAVKTLENTIKLKPDYKGGQAYYALAIFYHQLAVDPKGKVVNQELNQKAIDQLKLMEKLFGPNQQATDALKIWGGK